MALGGSAPKLQLFCPVLPGPDPCPAQGTDKQTVAPTTLATLLSTCPFCSLSSVPGPWGLPPTCHWMSHD